MRHVDGGCPNESAAMGPIANQRSPGGTDDMVSALARTPRTGTRFDSNSSPPCLLQPRLPFAVKRTNVGRWFNNVTFLPGMTVTHQRFIRADSTRIAARRDAPPPGKRRSDRRHQCPVTMIDGFPPSRGGRRRGARASRSASRRRRRRRRSGVQISPRVAATPSCPLAVVTRGPY